MKVTFREGIMEEHKKTAEEKGYVWYAYVGNPPRKLLYDGSFEEVYFIEKGKYNNRLYHAKFLEIIPGPKHGGKLLDDKELYYYPYPNEFKDFGNDVAFFVKCKEIRLKYQDFDYDKPLKNIYLADGKPFIANPKKVGPSGIFFINSKEEDNSNK
jgi:hypothetical protein